MDSCEKQTEEKHERNKNRRFLSYHRLKSFGFSGAAIIGAGHRMVSAGHCEVGRNIDWLPVIGPLEMIASFHGWKAAAVIAVIGLIGECG